MGFRLGLFIVIVSCISAVIALPTCVCTREQKPVCGSNGAIYNNKCQLDCAAASNPDITLEPMENCQLRLKRQEPRLCPCPAILDPVCGTDGLTYANDCDLRCQDANVDIAYKGECRPKREAPICVCTFEYLPICGTDGNTYPNKCSLRCAQQRSAVEMKHEGTCRTKREDINVADAPICPCTAELNPMCGTNGLTYPNPCMLNCAKKQSISKSLDLLHEGECETKPVEVVEGAGGDGCTCGKERDPVCASNGVTYANECIMNCAGEELAIVHSGQC